MIRKNVQLSEEMAEYIEKMSVTYGVSQSGFINIALAQYRQQAQTLAEMSKINTYLDKLEKICAKVEG